MRALLFVTLGEAAMANGNHEHGHFNGDFKIPRPFTFTISWMIAFGIGYLNEDVFLRRNSHRGNGNDPSGEMGHRATADVKARKSSDSYDGRDNDLWNELRVWKACWMDFTA
jgi:hypothetical protein